MSESFPKDVKLVIKQFPLAMHGYARKAATAALAAGRQGRFWEMHEKLFANQRDLNDVKVEAIAGELGLAPEVLATRREMEKLVSGARDGAVLSGWRREVIGERLLSAL